MSGYYGYKVKCGDGFPTVKRTFAEAESFGIRYALSTGKEARIYGITVDGQARYLKTCRKSTART